MAENEYSEFRIGISGWTYAPWRGVFYPSDLTHARELEYASRRLNSIEINGSFYSLQRPSSYEAWHDATPADFLFSVKGGRYVTHMKRLRDIEAPLANFFASGVLALKDKLGPILWQLPPNFSFDAEKLEAFFRQLPRDTAAAAAIARNHDERLKGRALIEVDSSRPMRHAIEVRNVSFETPQFIDLLRKYEIALVFADTAGRWPYSEDLTADFVYVRLHGDEELYASGYSPPALDWWAKRLQSWSVGKEPADARHWNPGKPAKIPGRDVYVYFDNDVKVKAPFDAMSLADRIGNVARGAGRVGESAVRKSPRLTKKAMSERVRSHWPAPIRKKKSKE